MTEPCLFSLHTNSKRVLVSELFQNVYAGAGVMHTVVAGACKLFVLQIRITEMVQIWS